MRACTLCPTTSLDHARYKTQLRVSFVGNPLPHPSKSLLGGRNSVLAAENDSRPKTGSFLLPSRFLPLAFPSALAGHPRGFELAALLSAYAVTTFGAQRTIILSHAAMVMPPFGVLKNTLF